MYCTVKRLRENGIRRPDRDIYSESGYTGHLTLASVEGTYVLKVHAPGDDSHRRPMIPELRHAQLVSMHGDKMMFRGVERIGNAELGQEWSVLVNAPKPDVPPPTTRLG